MSKIENALAKARAVAETRTTGMRLVPALPAQGEQESGRAGMSSSKEIARMREPGVLDAAALSQRRIIHPQMQDREAAGAFCELRTKILQKAARGCTIVVTACGEGGGSSFVALNLAVAFALDANKTALIMDCNLRNPRFSDLVWGNAASGVTDFLENERLPVEAVIHPTGIRRLRLVPVGRSNNFVAEYFTTARFRALLDGLRARYVDRYVIIDAPPIAESADSRTLAEVADYVVLVVPYGKVTEAQVAATVKTIQPGKLLGVVFNDVPPKWPKRFARLNSSQREGAGENVTKE